MAHICNIIYNNMIKHLNFTFVEHQQFFTKDFNILKQQIYKLFWLKTKNDILQQFLNVLLFYKVHYKQINSYLIQCRKHYHLS